VTCELGPVSAFGRLPHAPRKSGLPWSEPRS
jgi:hypothetical protein